MKEEIIGLIIITLEIIFFVLQLVFLINGEPAKSLLMCSLILLLSGILSNTRTDRRWNEFNSKKPR